MNDKDFFNNYNINWQQEYCNWYNFIDTMHEAMLESSDMKEAKDLINRIKNL